MTTVSLSSVINEKFLGLFSSAGSSSSSSSASIKPGASTTNLSSALRTGAQTFSACIQTLNSSVGFLNTTKADLKDVLEIAKKVESLAERAAKHGTSSTTRAQLAGEFKRLGDSYKRLMDNAKIGDYDVLSEEDLSSALQMVGLDKDSSDSIAAIFKRFKLAGNDDLLASEYIKGPRPVRVPVGAYMQQVIIPGTAGNGDGTFAAFVSVGYLPQSSSVKTTDLNKDGKADLVSQYVGYVETFISQGDGTFASAGTYASDGTSSDVGDVNGDGITDVVSVSYGGDTVLIGNGNGTFKTAVSCSDGATPYARLADVNGDGSLDIVGFADDLVEIAVNDTHGNFQSVGIVNTYQISDLKVADVNNDSRADVLMTTGDAGDYGLYVYLGNADGSLAAPVSVYTGAGGNTGKLATGFINADSRIDMMYDLGGPERLVILGNGDGTFSAISTVVATTSDYGDYQLADVNGDQKVDLVTAEAWVGINVLTGNGDGSFNELQSYDGPPYHNGISLADTRGNGILDIVALSSATGIDWDNVSVFLGNGNASVPASTTTAFVPRRSPEYSTLFDETRVLKRQVDGYYLLNDVKAFRQQIQDNIKAIDYALEVVGKNIELVRGAGFAFLDLSSQIKGSEEAEDVAQSLQQMIRANAPSALSQAENLNAIVVAALTITAGGIPL